MCLLLGSPIWYLLFHHCCRFIPGHPISLKLAWDLEIGVSIMLWAFLYVAGTSCTPVGVCTESRGVYCNGRHVLCVCIEVRRLQTCMFSSIADQLCYSATSLHCSSAVDYWASPSLHDHTLPKRYQADEVLECQLVHWKGQPFSSDGSMPHKEGIMLLVRW